MRQLRRMKSLAFTAAFLMAAVLPQPLFSSVLAQSSKGIIVGTTKDPSGAVVGGASIKLDFVEIVRKTMEVMQQ